MAYWNNFFHHLVAPLTGDGFRDDLARDFWSKEDLWDRSRDVQLRGLKLWWVYLASAVAQITVPSAVAIFFVDCFVRDVSPRWWFISVGFGTSLGVLFATLVALFTNVKIRNARSSRA